MKSQLFRGYNAWNSEPVGFGARWTRARGYRQGSDATKTRTQASSHLHSSASPLCQDDVCRRDKRTTRHLTNPTASVGRAFSKSVGFAEAISQHEEGSREVLNWGLEQVHLPINHSLQGWRPSQAVSPLGGKGPENGIAAPSVSQVSSVSQFNAAIVLLLKAAICLQHPFLGSKAHPQEALGEHGQPECGGRVRSLVSSLSQGKRLTWRKLP